MNLAIDINTAFNGLLVIMLGYAGWQFRRLINSNSQLEKDVEVIKVRLGDALNLKEKVEGNTENIIRFDERMQKCNKDINALHQAKRELYDKISSHN